MTKISIIVPVYNKGEFIKSCLESILVQTIRDFELIVVNDGSQDNSGEIIDSLAEIDDRIIVIHQENGGVSKARNVGLEIAQGDFIGFVDADDLLEEDMYEVLVNNIEEHDADISICGVKRIFPDKIDDSDNVSKLEIYNADQGLSKFFQGEILMSTYDKLYRKELVKDLRYRPALFEDTFYNFEAIKSSSKIVFDSVLKYKYIIRDNSHSMAAYGPKFFNTTLLCKEMVDICEQYHPSHIEEAKSFDFNLNMFVLNLILLGRKKTEDYHPDYAIIASNLNAYKSFYKSAIGVKRRYKLGYSMFSISPKLYETFLKQYTKNSQSEHKKRKKDNTSN